MATKPVVLAHHFADLDQQHHANTLGMWIFLATELMFFGGLFTTYTVYRFWYPLEFAAASGRLNLVYGGVNTLVLLTSSLTMALAVYGAQVNQRRYVTINLLLTALLGTVFLVIKGFEYYGDYHEHLIPGLAFDPQEWLQMELQPERVKLRPERVKLFLLCYYLMTGLHAIHLIIGIILIALLAYWSSQGTYSSAYYAPIEVGGLYWHFVDVVWIFLLPMLYLVSVR